MCMLNADIVYRAVLILLIVSMVSAGQVLFKYVSLMMAAGQSASLSFVMVPACGVFIFGDSLRGSYFLGIALIILGIIVITRQS